jgi:asparagine synthase (glutamine-hydrolysing)
MCGIAGIWDRRGASPEALLAQTAAMTETLAHRGPDGNGTWIDAALGVGLGHRRLAIIDLSPTGAQPMVSHCERYVISYNGELYNAPELRRELKIEGSRFSGSSDTEILLAAISTWGLQRALPRCNGMFAFALWDRKERELSLVRDRIGKKPLFWYRRGDLLLFGSEMKALICHPEFDRSLDRNALAAYLRHAYVPAPGGIFAGVEKVLPGSFVQFRHHGTMKRHIYWDVAQHAEKGLAEPRQISMADATAEADELLRDAAIKRTLSDVPLGVFLSGGIDSSLVAAVLSTQGGNRTRTFTVGFSEHAYNEAGHARAVADHLGTDHTEMTVTANDALEVVPKLSEWFDEPFADSSQIPTYLLSALTRQHVTVALSGDGGDEIAAGYVRHGAIGHWWPKAARYPATARRIAAGAISGTPGIVWDGLARMTPPQLRPAHAADKALKFARLLAAKNPIEVYRSLISQWPNPNDLVLGGREPKDVLDEPGLTERFADTTGLFQYLDMTGYLPDDILCKVDRASMAVALEVRSPLLDHRVIEFFWSLPRSYLRDGNERKILLKKLLSHYVPPELFERAKMGFGVPLKQWLRGPLRDWADDLLSVDRLRREGFLQPEPIRNAWDDHISGRADNEHRLWTVLMFQSWRKRWIDSPQVSARPITAAANVVIAAATQH